MTHFLMDIKNVSANRKSRLNKINEIKNFFIGEINERKIVSERLKNKNIF